MKLGKTTYALVIICTLTLLLLVNLPGASADTIGTTSTTGLTSYSSVSGWIWSAKFLASSGGSLASISLFVTGAGGSAQGNVGIYADSSGKPGALLAQGAPQTLTNGVDTFSTLSAPVTIVSGTSYWLAFEMTGASMYYGGTSGTRAAGAATCCTMPNTGISTYMYAGTYGIYATYGPSNDFSITASPTSVNVAAGNTATSTLNLAAAGSSSGTVNLSVTSGCPSGVTCTVNPTSVNTFPSSATLSVPTLITTTGSYSVVVTASNGTISHTVTVTVSVTGATSYTFNVRPGAAQITVTVSWTGTATASVTIAGPGGSPTISESAGVIYDRTTISVTSGSPTYSSVHRVTFTISPPASAQTWTVLLSISGTNTYNVNIEVS